MQNMNGCTEEPIASLFYDSALEGAARRDFERHLEGCAACRRAIQEFAAMSRVIERACAASRFSEPARESLAGRMRAATRRAVRDQDRLAIKLFAAAAMMFLTALGGNWYGRQFAAGPERATGGWEEYAVRVPGAIEDEEGSATEAYLVRWMTSSLSERNGND